MQKSTLPGHLWETFALFVVLSAVALWALFSFWTPARAVTWDRVQGDTGRGTEAGTEPSAAAKAGIPPPAPDWITCPVCEGRGVVMHVFPHGDGTESSTGAACPRCSGRGVIGNPALRSYYRPWRY